MLQFVEFPFFIVSVESRLQHYTLFARHISSNKPVEMLSIYII
jgi:hypothetical protein